MVFLFTCLIFIFLICHILVLFLKKKKKKSYSESPFIFLCFLGYHICFLSEVLAFQVSHWSLWSLRRGFFSFFVVVGVCVCVCVCVFGGDFYVGNKYTSNSILLQVDIQFVQHNLLKMLSFLQCVLLATLSNITWPLWKELMYWSSIFLPLFYFAVLW
jgi:hypothetical protein